MRLAGENGQTERGKGRWGDGGRAVADSRACFPFLLSFFLFPFFFSPTSPFRPVPPSPCLPFSPSPAAAHHCVKTITARGIPSRKPRCGTSNEVTALPQRRLVSGIIVYECGSFTSMAAKPASFCVASFRNIHQPSPPLSSI